MSKSLKNFITIKALLEKYTSNQIRLLFLLHKYDTLMSFNATSFDEALPKEKYYKEFFLSMRANLRQYPLNNA